MNRFAPQAALPGVDEAAPATALRHDDAEVGVVEHDERVGSAEFEHGLFLTARPAAVATWEPARLLPVTVTAAIRSSGIRSSTAVGTSGSAMSRVVE